MFRFYNPLWLILLAGIPAIVYFYLIRKSVRFSSLRYSDLSWYNLIKKPGFNKRNILFILRLLALVVLILALSRPQSGSTSRDVESEGINIILCLDISGSMQAEDFKPHNRLYAAKQVIRDFIKGRKTDRVGLVVFAKESVTQCPLTNDYSVLENFLDQVQIGQIEDGTAIGLGLATGVNRLRYVPGKSKVIILLTDGNNNAGEIEPLTAAELASLVKIRIYTIGAGKLGESYFNARDPVTGQVITYRLPELDESILKEIARQTGGEYFRATDEKALASIYKQIDEMEKTRVKVKEYTQYAELFPYFLWTGLIMVLVEAVLNHTLLRKLP
jgi:Ca-activated chloride channel family protein